MKLKSLITRNRIGFGYSTLKEAEGEAVLNRPTTG
jgi:hypothetical protein